MCSNKLQSHKPTATSCHNFSREQFNETVINSDNLINNQNEKLREESPSFASKRITEYVVEVFGDHLGTRHSGTGLLHPFSVFVLVAAVVAPSGTISHWPRELPGGCLEAGFHCLSVVVLQCQLTARNFLCGQCVNDDNSLLITCKKAETF